MQTSNRKTFIFLSLRYLYTNKDSRAHDFLLFKMLVFSVCNHNTRESLSEKYAVRENWDLHMLKEYIVVQWDLQILILLEFCEISKYEVRHAFHEFKFILIKKWKCLILLSSINTLLNFLKQYSLKIPLKIHFRYYLTEKECVNGIKSCF